MFNSSVTDCKSSAHLVNSWPIYYPCNSYTYLFRKYPTSYVIMFLMYYCLWLQPERTITGFPRKKRSRQLWSITIRLRTQERMVLLLNSATWSVTDISSLLLQIQSKEHPNLNSPWHKYLTNDVYCRH
jgi:hypothetical protein